MQVILPNFEVSMMKNSLDCGPTVIHQLLRYYKDSNLAYDELLTTWGWSCRLLDDTPLDHKRVMKKLGIPITFFHPTPKTITDSILAGHPVVILVKKDTFFYHWEVIVGYDWDGNWLISTGKGLEHISPKQLTKELFTTYKDTEFLDIENLAYVHSGMKKICNVFSVIENLELYFWYVGVIICRSIQKLFS